jgi:hypothetical protein
MAVPPGQLVELRELAAIWDLPITVIGHFQDGPGEVLLKSPGEVVALVAASHDHFKGRPLSVAGEEGG